MTEPLKPPTETNPALNSSRIPDDSGNPEMLRIRNEKNQKSKTEEKMRKETIYKSHLNAPLVRLRKIFSRAACRCTKGSYVVYDAYTFADFCCKTQCCIWVYGVYGPKIYLDESILEMAKRPVSVRVEQHIFDELDARAKSLGKKDRSAHLRDLIIDDLVTADKAKSRNPEIVEVRQEFRALRNCLATAVVGLLTNLGHDISEQQAEAWVKEHL